MSIKFKLTLTYLPFVQPSPESDEFLHIHIYIYIQKYIYIFFYTLYYIMHVESVKLSCDKHNNDIY